MKVGFIGLGVMGNHMARHLSKRYEVLVFDVDESRMASFDPAQRAQSIQEVGEKSSVVLLSLPSTPIVENVVVGDEGLIAAMGAGKAVIDTSTTSPNATRRVAAALAAQGIEFMDAPVSGGEGGATNASLSIMVGGDNKVLEKYREVLETIGGSVVRVGDVGAGEVAKLVNNMIVGSAFTVAAEGFALAVKNGLDPQQLYDAIKGGWAGSPVLDVAVPSFVKRDYNPPNGINILYKDLGYALELARDQDIPTPMTAQVNEVFKAARATGRGGLFQPAIVGLWEDALGIEVGGSKENDRS